jgi:DNA-binding transcriptional regulator LsrR (DeoR family)
MLQRRQRIAGQVFNDAWDRIQRAIALFAEQFMEIVVRQQMMLGFKTGSAVGDLSPRSARTLRSRITRFSLSGTI